MVNEEMLKKAADEAAQKIMASFPVPQECKHEFSPSFHKKMRRVFHKANHPVIYKLPRWVAGIVLVVILAGGTELTVDAEARAAFFAWVREKYEAFVEYRFTGDASDEGNTDAYELAWLPDGFSLMEEHVLGGSTLMIYTNDFGQRITFSYLQGDDAVSMFITSDYVEVKTVQIGDIKADYYRAGQEESADALVWISEKGDITFSILANLPEDIVIKLAEGVKIKNMGGN